MTVSYSNLLHKKSCDSALGTVPGGHESDAMQKKRHEGRVLRADVPIALLPGGQRRQGGPEMTLGVAVQAARTATTLPLPAQCQGHHRAPAQGGLWARVGLRGQRGLAQVVGHHVKSRQEGVHIDHSMCSLSWGR